MASPDIDFAIPAALQAQLDRLRQLNTLDIQRQWRWHASTGDIAAMSHSQTQAWPIAPINNRQHIAWEKGRQVRWLYQSITVPTQLNGYPLTGLILRLALTWWADDAKIYIDGALVQSGDLFECFARLSLSAGVTPGETFKVAIRLVSPGHDDGALVRSQLIYELPAHQPTPEPSFVADELTVLATLEPETQAQIQTALTQLNWNSLANVPSPKQHPDKLNPQALDLWNTLSDHPLPATATTHLFQQSLSQLRRTLRPLCAPLKQRTIQCVGHAHLDMAWLWPIADTWNAAERTFNSVLNLQKDFPELTYTHSSPALFEWLEHNRPDLFQQIQQTVKDGSWSIDAGLWIEPEFNVISGEAIARHILYGQRYCQEKFGTLSTIAWLPDSFGFCWQLPQLLTQGGIETFATLKLSWNDTTEFPYSLFWWQSPDGSRIRSLMLPPIGTDIDPVKMSIQAKKWETKTHSPHTLWLPGLGDHGGGPTRDMLEKAHRWQNSPFFPTLSFTTPNRYIDNLVEDLTDHRSAHHPEAIADLHETAPAKTALPIWKDELYLELHRGCYTTHADQKQQNRRCEDLLYQAEVFATIAQITTDRPYPKAALDAAWKTLLFNQFHDILPGTSIPEVFADANRDWEKVQAIGNQVLNESIEAIASNIHLPHSPHPEASPVLIFNSLSYQRSSIVKLNLSEKLDPPPSNWIVYGPDQQIIAHQKSSIQRGETTEHHLLFLAPEMPALGYQCFWIRHHSTPATSPKTEISKPKHYSLENEFIKAVIDPKTGHIISLIEKSTQTETFSAPGNQLQAFRDQGQYWDAWNIAPDYKNHPLPEPTLQTIQPLETGPIRQSLRITYKLNQSTLTQDYILDTGTPFLTIENHIDWQETQVLLKVNFPLTTSATVATYEIPFGAITRTTNPQTEVEKAKWEVPALRWADISDQHFGTSLLTDCKHGFDASPNHLRLTLLKSPIWPDPTADKGTHRFTYALYPHPGTWQSARTVQHARALNIAPIAYHFETIHPKTTALKPSSPNTHSFLTIHNRNIILSALKPAENNAEEFVLRCYEAHGETTSLATDNTLGLSGLSNDQMNRTDLLERSANKKHPTRITPWQISTYRLTSKKLS